MRSGTELADRYLLQYPLPDAGTFEAWRARDPFPDREVAVRAATCDGQVHVAVHEIEVIRTGLSRCPAWSPVPGHGAR